MKAYLILGSILAILAAIGGAYLTGRSHGVDSCQNKTLKTEIKEVRHEAQSFANRPRTRSDRVNRLCEWRGIVTKDKGQPVARLSAESCP